VIAAVRFGRREGPSILLGMPLPQGLARRRRCQERENPTLIAEETATRTGLFGRLSGLLCCSNLAGDHVVVGGGLGVLTMARGPRLCMAVGGRRTGAAANFYLHAFGEVADRRLVSGCETM